MEDNGVTSLLVFDFTIGNKTIRGLLLLVAHSLRVSLMKRLELLPFLGLILQSLDGGKGAKVTLPLCLNE